MNAKAKLFIATTIAYFGLGVSSSWATTVGAYCGKDTEFSVETTRGFIDVTGASQWYYANRYIFSDWNNWYIDAVDFAVFSGHGGAFAVNTLTDDWIGFDGIEGNDPKYPAGDTGSGGWGDQSLRHLVFSSCDVVASPIERGDWWNWRDACHVWTGIRHIIGYRTEAGVDSARDILHQYAVLLTQGYTIIDAWFYAIDLTSSHPNGRDYGSIVYHPAAYYDTFNQALPRAPDQNLSILYQY